MRRRGFTLIELVVSVVVLAVMLVIAVPALFRAGEMSRRNTCQNNLKQLGAAFKLYANEQRGYWPSVQYETIVDPVLASAFLPGHPAGLSKGQRFAATAPLMRSVFPDYLSDPSILICPGDPDTTADSLRDASTGKFAVADYGSTGKISQTGGSYVYLGYLMDKLGDDTEQVFPATDPTFGDANIQLVLTFSGLVSGCGAVDDGAAHGIVLGGQETLEFNNAPPAESPLATARARVPALRVPTPEWSRSRFNALRLREGLYRIYMDLDERPCPERQAFMYVLFERPQELAGTEVPAGSFPHSPGGSNVLYADGHVEFVAYGTAPVSRSVGVALGMAGW